MTMLKIPKKDKGQTHIARRHARTQEKRVADRVGTDQIRGSGCGAVRGDSRKKGVLRLENKCTTKKSFSITIEMLEKIESAGLMSGECPAIQIEFIDETGKVKHSCVVIPEYMLDEWMDGENV